MMRSKILRQTAMLLRGVQTAYTPCAHPAHTGQLVVLLHPTHHGRDHLSGQRRPRTCREQAMPISTENCRSYSKLALFMVQSSEVISGMLKLQATRT